MGARDAFPIPLRSFIYDERFSSRACIHQQFSPKKKLTQLGSVLAGIVPYLYMHRGGQRVFSPKTGYMAMECLLNWAFHVSIIIVMVCRKIVIEQGALTVSSSSS